MNKYLTLLFLMVPLVLSGQTFNVGDYTINKKTAASGPLTPKYWAGANSTLWGTNGSGDPQSITVGSGLNLTGSTLTATGGGGDVVGPASATDNAIVRFDLTTGKLIQNSGITIADGATGTLSGTNTGDLTLNATVTDLFSLTGQELTADDPGADRLLFWDDSEGKLTHLTIGSGLSITGTTITATGSGDVTGPASSTDNAIARFDLTTGKVIQNSGITIADGATGTLSGTNSGDVTLAASVTDVFSLTGQALSADDPGADRILFWDDSEGKITHLTVGAGLAISGATLSNTTNASVFMLKSIYDETNTGYISGRVFSTMSNPGTLKLDTGADDGVGAFGGAGGSIDMRGSDAVLGNNGNNGGFIDMRGGELGAGGTINITNNGGTLNMSGGVDGQGGSINTSSGGGAINTSNLGGEISTSASGGSIFTFGLGHYEWGNAGTRTTVVGTATADRAISWPDADGTVALTADLAAYQPLDTLLTDLSALSYTGNAGKYLQVNATEDGWQFDTPAGTGDVVGPASATDEAIARFDLTTGKLLQNSVVTITDAGIVSGSTQLNVDNLRLDGNALSATNTNGNVELTPAGTGRVQSGGVNIPTISSSDTFTNKTLGSSTSVTSSISWGDGVKQTFNPDATNAGINVGSQAGDPSTPANGDLWYDSTANELTARINGANVALGAGSSGGSNYAVLGSNVAITDNTTLQNITGLSFAVAANTVYEATFYVDFTTSAAGTGSEIGITGPSSPTSFIAMGYIPNAAPTEVNGIATAYGTIVSNGNGSTASRPVRVHLFFRNGANAGTVQLQAKVENAISGTVTALAGSAVVWRVVTTP